MADAGSEPGRLSRAWRGFRNWPMWLQVVAWVALVIVVAGALAEPPATDTAVETDTTAADTTTTRQPTTTKASTTTTTEPTTTTTTAPPEPIEVARFQGSTDTQTDDFLAAGKWTISADVSGGAGVSIEIYSSDGGQLDYVSFEPGTHTSQFRNSCAPCYFDISTFGSTYNVVVTDTPG